MVDPRRTAEPVSEAELNHEAVITDRDVREDRVFWHQHGSTLTNAMLDAEEERA